MISTPKPQIYYLRFLVTKRMSRPVTEAKFDCGRVDFYQKSGQDVLNKRSNQHRYSVGVSIPSQDEVALGVEGFRLKSAARLVVAWVEHAVVMYVARIVA